LAVFKQFERAKKEAKPTKRSTKPQEARLHHFVRSAQIAENKTLKKENA